MVLVSMYAACAAVGSGAAEGFNKGLNSGSEGECSSSISCTGNQVCMIPKGKDRGQCMEAR